MKLLDVEELAAWALGELARKKPGGAPAPPQLDLPREDRELVGKWARPMGYPPMSAMFARGFAQQGGAREPPHADALIFETALERLGREGAPAQIGAGELALGLGFEIEVEKPMRDAHRRASTFVTVHARLGDRPDVRREPPEPSAKLGANGKPGVWRRELSREATFDDHAEVYREVEAPCAATRRGVYPSGAYGVVEWTPEPQAIVLERAEYAAWRAGLEWLAGELHGRLASRAALPPRAALRPWAGESDGPPVRDFYAAGADRVYSGAEAAAMRAERKAGRRRPVAGGTVYALAPEADGAEEWEA